MQHLLVDKRHISSLGCNIRQFLDLFDKRKRQNEANNTGSLHTNVQVPLLTMTMNLLRSGVLSDSGSHASSTTVVSVLVAKVGSVSVIGKGKASK